MPKYRLLTLDELEPLQQDFIEFLVVNGIVAEDWEAMKINEKAKAERILELFSDMVLETVLRKIKFVEYREKSKVSVIQFLDETQVLVGLEVPENAGLDCTNLNLLQKMDADMLEGAQVFTTSKKYLKSREEELFLALQSGASITDDKLFNALCLAL